MTLAVIDRLMHRATIFELNASSNVATPSHLDCRTRLTLIVALHRCSDNQDENPATIRMRQPPRHSQGARVDIYVSVLMLYVSLMFLKQ